MGVAGRSARPRRNYLDGFEQQPLIVRRAYLVSSGRMRFALVDTSQSLPIVTSRRPRWCNPFQSDSGNTLNNSAAVRTARPFVRVVGSRTSS
jgi:hypothetical protein